MSQPPAYSRAFSFTNYQAANPSLALPGSQVDLELNNAKATLDATLANLALIQRDDGQVKNASIGLDQLKTEVPLGFNVPQVWVTGTAYTANSSTVFNGSGFYRALTTHTSGTFATDLAALKWQLIVNLAAIPLVTATQIAVTPSGLLTTDAQTSLQALDTGKAALSHTQAASTISDSTAAGRAMLLAADVAAQKALLSLGTLAFLNTLPVTAITANLAFTNPIIGSLLANANDWSPTGWATAAIIRLTASSAVNITGMAATSDGDIKIVYNTGSNIVTMLIESTSSAAANRIAGPTLPISFTIPPGNGVPFIYDGTAARWRVLSPIVVAPIPTTQVFTSGSGTYTTPAKVAYIRVRLIGGGGGGGGGQNATPGSTGGSTTFSAFTAAGGVGGGLTTAGTGGAASGGYWNTPGGNGGGGHPPSTAYNAFGGIGGSSSMGGGGAAGVTTGGAGATNSGGGGGGGGATNGTITGSGGAGGGAGATVVATINAPAATYSYGVGAGGAGAAGSSSSSSAGSTGGAGAAGIIVVEEYY